MVTELLNESIVFTRRWILSEPRRKLDHLTNWPTHDFARNYTGKNCLFTKKTSIHYNFNITPSSYVQQICSRVRWYRIYVMKVSLKVDCLPYAGGKQLSIALINLEEYERLDDDDDDVNQFQSTTYHVLSPELARGSNVTPYGHIRRQHRRTQYCLPLDSGTSSASSCFLWKFHETNV